MSLSVSVSSQWDSEDPSMKRWSVFLHSLAPSWTRDLLGVEIIWVCFSLSLRKPCSLCAHVLCLLSLPARASHWQDETPRGKQPRCLSQHLANCETREWGQWGWPAVEGPANWPRDLQLLTGTVTGIENTGVSPSWAQSKPLTHTIVS